MTPSTPDCIDAALGIAADSPLDALRRRRDKVRDGTQGSYEALFDSALPPPELRDRLLVALHAARLSDATELASHYRRRLLELPADAALLEAAERGREDAIADTRLQAMLRYARTLLLRPLDGDRAALQVLAVAGLDTAQIVALSQLIAFLSYQVRLAAGLRALAALEAAA
ncbi:hypothetical protein JR065_16085 [Xanthomonas sp. AmX2]|uniref:CMD domain-containing protein n=1 Tax=Xanthomonas sp. TaxID=29446 RepID=UPI00197EB8D2|nr:hypothetical protein [Xanthomonas sp.]MBN6151867.1 hypothetical protein [Xanthomonas sp.]